MRSFIKIYGPPLLKSIKKLEALAIDMPEVCIMDTLLAANPQVLGAHASDQMDFFSSLGHRELTELRCSTLISESGELLGEYDFFFEWFRDPTTEELHQLMEKIDEDLAPLGCKYTITTKD